MKPIYLLNILLLFFLSSCYYDKEEELYPDTNNQCDTLNVKYSTHISQLMSSYCNNCHGANAASIGGGIDLRTYNEVKAEIDRIYGCIDFQDGYSPMPQNSSKLNDCKITQFRIWKNQGGLNN